MSMNLHAVVGPAVGVINANVPVTVRLSTGEYEISEDGIRTPLYDNVQNVTAQIQSLSAGDLQKLDGLNIQGEQRKIYLYGRFDSINRVRQTGGDIVQYPDGEGWPYGTTWLITQVMEQFRYWCCVAVTLQLPEAFPLPSGTPIGGVLSDDFEPLLAEDGSPMAP